MFTKEHYIEIAKLLKKRRIWIVVHDYIELFTKDSKKFDKEKFLDAIYGKGEKSCLRKKD